MGQGMSHGFIIQNMRYRVIMLAGKVVLQAFFLLLHFLKTAMISKTEYDSHE